MPGWTGARDKVGYEVNFNRHFYRYTPPRPLEEIDADSRKRRGNLRLLKRGHGMMASD